MPEKKLIQTFTAEDDGGNAYILNVFQDQLPAGTRENPKATIPGLKEIRTEDGSAVNQKERGVYEIAATGTILRSDDSVAP